jgi:HSP20 family protein
MAITDLLPWNRNKDELEIRQEPEQDPVLALQDEIDNLFDDFFNRPFGLLRRPSRGFETLRKFSPSIDVSETAKQVNIKAELPGMEADDIDLEVRDEMVLIRGEKKSEREQKDEQFYRLERSYGSFHRSIPLPAEIDVDKAKANFKNGVLSIKLPKVKPSQPRRKIDVKAG